MGYPNNFLGFVDGIQPAQLSGPHAERFFGLYHGVSFDLFAELLRFTVHAPWLRDPESPDDVLPYIAAERTLPKYGRETEAEWRARLADAWRIYKESPSSAMVAEQLAAAKFSGGGVFFDPTRHGPHGEAPPYWSQFWIRLPPGSHYVEIGSAMSDEDFADIKFIAYHFSDVRYVPRGIIVEFAEDELSGFVGDSWLGDSWLGDGAASSVTFEF